MSGLSYDITLKGDRDMFERLSNKLLDPRDFMGIIGQYGIGQAQQRLTEVLRQDAEAVRTGRLESSLTIFDLEDNRVTYGSNLAYAAQVHFGGTIYPREAKALAIPLVPALKRAQLGPLDIDPGREILEFVPIRSSQPNVIGLLIDPEEPLSGRQRKRRGHTPYGPGALYALATSVTQQARPYCYLDDEDKRVIAEELWPAWING